MILSLVEYKPSPRYDGNPWTTARVDGKTDTSDWSSLQTYDLTLDVDPTEPTLRSFTVSDVPSDITYLRVAFLDDDAGQEVTDPIGVAPAMTFASVRNVRLRLGTDLSEEQIAQVEELLYQATVSIYMSLGVPSTFTPPAFSLPFLGLLCTELTCRTMANPLGVMEKSESLGSYSYTTIYNPRNAPPPSPMMLRPTEELAARQTVFGSNIASYAVKSQADHYADLIWPQREAEWALFYGPFAAGSLTSWI